MRHKAPDYLYGNLSDVGKVRSENQDYYGRYEGEYGNLIIVCDGMGGYKGGAIASRLAVESVSEHFKKLGAHYEPKFELTQALLYAQESIMTYSSENPDTEGMGTTAVILLIRDSSYWFANVGDSRIYVKRGGRVTQLTKDHSLVQDMIDSGILTVEQAAEHPKRNIITRALGTGKFDPDISGPFPLYQQDVFMLCSDGLYHYFTTQEMEKILDMDPQAACEALVNEANRQGSDDNVTVQVVKANVGSRFRMQVKGGGKVKWAYIGLISFVILLLACVFLWRSISDFSNKHQTKAVVRDSVVSGSEKQIPLTPRIDSTRVESEIEREVIQPSSPKPGREGTHGE